MVKVEHEYTLLPRNTMKKGCLRLNTLPNDDSAITSVDHTILTYPFSNLTITSHVRPEYVIYNAGKKISRHTLELAEQNIAQLSSKYWECTILGRRMSPPSSWSKSSPRPIPQPAHKTIRVEGRICGIMTHQYRLLRGKGLWVEVGRLKVGME